MWENLDLGWVQTKCGESIEFQSLRALDRVSIMVNNQHQKHIS